MPSDPETSDRLRSGRGPSAAGARARAACRLFLAGITAAKLWLDSALRVKAETFQTFDDALYVRLARSILAGRWLGEYDHVTLTKNPLYPLFLALNHAAGTPLLLAQSALYAGAGLVLAREVRKLGVHRSLAAALYAIYLFNPFVEIRVMREGIYSSLLVLTLALLLRLNRRVTAGDRALGASAAFGIGLACAWLTREEGVLLLPPVALVLVALSISVVRRTGKERGLLPAAAALVVPLVVPFAILGRRWAPSPS